MPQEPAAEGDPPVRIRASGLGDVEKLVSLWIDLIEHHRRLDPEYPALPSLKQTLRREVERGIRARHSQILIAEDEGRALGFLFAQVESGSSPLAGGPGTAWIHEIYLAEDARGRGTGRALVAAAERFFEARGGSKVAVRVEVSNVGAVGFWRRLGFEDRAHVLERSGGGPGPGPFTPST